jgi:hypothetical protein
MVAQLVLLVLSAVSLGSVRWLLAQPYRPEMVLMAAPTVIFDAPDTTTDWIGLI